MLKRCVRLSVTNNMMVSLNENLNCLVLFSTSFSLHFNFSRILRRIINYYLISLDLCKCILSYCKKKTACRIYTLS
jgi:hypothetical protein